MLDASGQPEKTPPPPLGGRWPVLAAVASFLLPGLGQILCGQDNKGVYILGLALLGHWLTGGISSALLCPAMGLDAFLVAVQLKRGRPVQRWEFLPGFKPLKGLKPNVFPRALAILVLAITLIRIVLYSRD
jgi:hypothetical protein